MNYFMTTAFKDDLRNAKVNISKSGIVFVETKDISIASSGDTIIFADGEFCACYSSGQATDFFQTVKRLEEKGIKVQLVHGHSWGALEIRGTEEEIEKFKKYYIA